MKSEAFAPAKVNLTLHVTGQRPDGYHLLDSLVVFAEDAFDRLEFLPADALSLEVTGRYAEGVPTDERNLVWKAAEMVGYCGKITLEKNLPHGAGIGGGSSDAAAVIRQVARSNNEREPRVRYREDALALGADVLVCVDPSPQRMRGIGDSLVSLPELPPFDLVLVNPGVTVPTADVFKALSVKDNDPMPGALPDFIKEGSPGDPFGQMCDWLNGQRNDLEAPACSLFPEIGETLKALSDAEVARMSGSGSTCFGIYKDGREAAQRIANEHPDWWVVRSDICRLS